MLDTFQYYLDNEIDFVTTNNDFHIGNNIEKIRRKEKSNCNLNDEELEEKQDFNFREDRKSVHFSSTDFKLISDVTSEIEINYSNDTLNSEINVNSFILPINIRNKNLPKKVNFSKNIIGTTKLFELMKEKKREKNMYLCAEFFKWILSWFQDVKDFCQDNINNIDAWNYEINRLMSFRYYSFLLFRAIKYLSSFKLEFEKKLEKKNYTGFDKEEENFSRQTICEEFILEHLRSFLLCLEKSFSVLAGQLLQEGKVNFCFIFFFNFIPVGMLTKLIVKELTVKK